MATRVLEGRLTTQVIAAGLESTVFTTHRGRRQVVAGVDDRTEMLGEDGAGEDLRPPDLAVLAQNRSGVYGFLAAFYNELPDDAFVEALRSSSFREAVGKVVDQADASDALREGGRLIRDALEGFRTAPAEEVKIALGVDRTRLVRGIKPGYGPPPPYESVYLAPGSQPLVQATVAVVRAYAEAGWVLSEATHDPPDFIGIELEFMRYLARQESKAWAREDEAQVREALGREHCFLQDHLGKWVDDYCQRMEQDAELDFYRGVALLTRQWVKEDMGYVEALVEAG